MVKSITIKRLNMKNAYNKLLKRDKLQLASSAPLHILANYNLPLNRALGISGGLVKYLGILVSILFIALAVAHLFLEQVTVDSITIILLVLASLPWLFPYLKSLELPGGIKVELKDALKKVESATPEATSEDVSSKYDGVNSSLAFVALRVEIEKTIRKYQTDLGHKKSSLSIRLQILSNDGVISKPLSDALLEIVKLGNAAAHGQEIDSEEAELILMRSDSLLDKLEGSLKNA